MNVVTLLLIVLVAVVLLGAVTAIAPAGMPAQAMASVSAAC